MRPASVCHSHDILLRKSKGGSNENSILQEQYSGFAHRRNLSSEFYPAIRNQGNDRSRADKRSASANAARFVQLPSLESGE
jgi:hypothetical protein